MAKTINIAEEAHKDAKLKATISGLSIKEWVELTIKEAPTIPKSHIHKVNDEIHDNG